MKSQQKGKQETFLTIHFLIIYWENSDLVNLNNTRQYKFQRKEIKLGNSPLEVVLLRLNKWTQIVLKMLLS